MAIGTWATLADAQKLTEDMKIAGVIEEIVKEGGILPRLPGLTVKGKSVVYNRENAIPTANFYAIDNTDFSADIQTAIKYDSITESLTVVIAAIDLDHFILDVYPTKNDMRAAALSALRKGYARKLEETLIYGDGTSNTFKGLQKLSPLACLNDIKTMNLSSTFGATKGIPAPLSLAQLDQLIDLVKPKPDVLLTSTAIRRRLSQALRNTGVAGYINWARDEFGKQILVYNDLPVLTSDYMTMTEAIETPNDWVADTAYSLGDFVKPTTVNGYTYECVTAGTSHGTTEPTWQTVLGTDLTDNTVVWRCRAYQFSAPTGGASGSILAIRFGQIDDGGVCLLTGGGEVIQSKSIPQLEGSLQGREILFSFIGTALGSTLSLGRIVGITDAAVVA